MEKFTVIYQDEDIIGKVEEVIKCFLTELSKILNDDTIEIEEKINQLYLIQDLIKQLEKENNSTIIKVSYNPMGAFYYKYMVEEE